jgi:ATPase family associated with various cellular activities (AAA)/TAZ zinc finger
MIVVVVIVIHRPVGSNCVLCDELIGGWLNQCNNEFWTCVEIFLRLYSWYIDVALYSSCFVIRNGMVSTAGCSDPSALMLCRTIGDGELFGALSNAPRDSIALIEDVDCAFQRETRGGITRFSGPVTISGLLNAMDGMAAQEGRLIFLTTNHKDQLSDSLRRPGRVDAQYYLGNASKVSAGELFDQFFSPSPGVNGEEVNSARDAFVAEVESGVHSFATLQGVLMQARDDPNLAAEGMRSLFTQNESSELNTLGMKGLGIKEKRETRFERLDDTVQARLQLFLHAATCEGCTSSNCKAIKNYIDHSKTCEAKPQISMQDLYVFDSTECNPCKELCRSSTYMPYSFL